MAQEKNPPTSARDVDPLEEEMATHSVFLPGKSQGQRSLVGYSLWGRKRARHDWVTKQQQPYDPEIELHLSQENKNVYSHKI